MSKRAEFLILMSFHSCILIVALADTQTNAQCCLQEKIGAQCVPCPMGSYCKKNYRNETLCLSCSVANLYDNEVILKNCTPFSDAVIGCSPDFFRRQIQHEFDCTRCAKCHNAYEARSCTGTTDTVCCPTPGMDAVSNGRGGFKCGLTCKRGQYLNTRLRRCLPCPARTYMPADDHNYTSCWLCFNYQGHHDRDNYRLVQLCDTANNEEIECKPGFYKKQIGDPKFHEAQCMICSICALDPLNQFESRLCGQTSNTVCCPSPGMTARLTQLGYHCETPKTGFSESVKANIISGLWTTVGPGECTDGDCLNRVSLSTTQQSNDDVKSLSPASDRNSPAQTKITNQTYRAAFVFVAIVFCVLFLFTFVGVSKF